MVKLSRLRALLAFASIVPLIISPADNPRGLYLELVKRAIKGSFIFCSNDQKPYAFTLLSWERLNNLQFCAEDVIAKSIPGDFIETGTWRGGATIFMRALLKAYNQTDRVVWVADSFEGFPVPDTSTYPADASLAYLAKDYAVPLREVKGNFNRFGLLDNQVKFLKGWFKDTLPSAPIEKLAILRLDGDLYESTLEALTTLYPKLSIGGYVIIDDYGHFPACAKAVQDYRKAHNITEKIEVIDYTGVFWKKIR
jgi:hypothetical protein